MKPSLQILLSSVLLLTTNSLLAMDPLALKEETKAFGEGLEILGNKVPLGRPNVSTRRTTHVSEVSILPESSSVALRTAAAVTAEEDTDSQLLEEEIVNNIYMGCVAKVATITLAERTTMEGRSQEAKEWAAAEKKATCDVNKCKRALEKARKEKETAEKKLNSATASLHGKAYADEAYYNFQVKELAEALAEAKVVTAEATLMAIEVRGTAQSAGAEADLAKAIDEEKTAAQSLEAATAYAGTEHSNSLTSSTSVQLIYSVSENVPIKQGFVPSAIPLVEATGVSFHNNASGGVSLNQQNNQLKLSTESDVQERRAVWDGKKKTTAIFEVEFFKMIESAKVQAEEVAARATAARDRAERITISVKEWNDALEEAVIAEEAYVHLSQLYKMYQKQMADHYEGEMLNAKCSQYAIEFKRTEIKKRHWVAEAAECMKKKLQNILVIEERSKHAFIETVQVTQAAIQLAADKACVATTAADYAAQAAAGRIKIRTAPIPPDLVRTTTTTAKESVKKAATTIEIASKAVTKVLEEMRAITTCTSTVCLALDNAVIAVAAAEKDGIEAAHTTTIAADTAMAAQFIRTATNRAKKETSDVLTKIIDAKAKIIAARDAFLVYKNAAAADNVEKREMI